MWRRRLQLGIKGAERHSHRPVYRETNLKDGITNVVEDKACRYTIISIRIFDNNYRLQATIR